MQNSPYLGYATALIPLLLVCGFVGMWMFVCALISRFGGWGELAALYTSSFPFTGEKYYFRYGEFGWASYRSCLTVGANHSHMFLSVFALFKFRHPDLQIPWNEIKVTSKRRLFIKFACFQFLRLPDITLLIPMKLAADLARASAGGLVLPVDAR